jgi:hypothetical protein
MAEAIRAWKTWWRDEYEGNVKLPAGKRRMRRLKCSGPCGALVKWAGAKPQPSRRALRSSLCFFTVRLHCLRYAICNGHATTPVTPPSASHSTWRWCPRARQPLRSMH